MSNNNGCWNCAFSGQAKDSGVCERCCHTDKSSIVDNWTKATNEVEHWCDYCKYKSVPAINFPCLDCVNGLGDNERPNRWESACTLPNVGAVEHPEHYALYKYECIDVMTEVFGAEAVKAFCLCNAFKYLWRCDRKGAKKEDVEKSGWYLKKYTELEEKQNGKTS